MNGITEKNRCITIKHFWSGYVLSFIIILILSEIFNEYYVFGRDFFGEMITALVMAPPTALCMCSAYNAVYRIQ